MPETDISQLTTTLMKTGVPDYKVQAKVIDEAGIQPETYWTNPNWATYFGYYKSIPELRQAINSLATWTAGKGWIAESLTKTILNQIKGWGEDSFDSLMQQAIIMKKINGDAYFEVMRHDKVNTLINLKPLNPSRVRHVVNPKGLLIAYDVMQADGKYKRFQPEEIFHIVNERTANEIHGTSVIESVKWVIDARNEAMSDLRRIMHRSTVRVLYIDMDNTTKLGTVREQYKEAIKNGEVLILPGKKGQDFEIEDLSVPPVVAFMEWIRYLENFFYQAVGVPKVILGGSQEFTEASSKVGYLTFEQVYATEQRLLEQDIWNQLGIKITFNRPVSLKEDVVTSEAANTGQVGFQPNETEATMTRTE